MKQINRPEKIVAILKKIEAHFADGIGADLEAYISDLEDSQKDVQPDNNSSWDVDNPPVWSHAQQQKRAQHRREREEKNRKAYQ